MTLELPGELLNLIAEYYISDNTEAVLLSQVSKKFYSIVTATRRLARVVASGKYALNEEMIRWMASVKCQWGDTFAALVGQNKLPLLKFLTEVGCYPRGKPFDYVAAPKGYLEILQWAHEERYLTRHNLLSRGAARYGQLEVLKWLILQGYPVEESICRYAAQQEHVMEWLLKNNYTCDEDTLREIAEVGSVRTMKLARKYTICKLNEDMTIRASLNSIEMLEYFIDEGVQLSKQCYKYPCIYGNYETVLFLHERKCPIPAYILIDAATSGNIEILKFLKRRNRMWYTPEPVYQAARFNRYEAVMWLIQNGCAWKTDALLATNDTRIKEYLLNCGVPPTD